MKKTVRRITAFASTLAILMSTEASVCTQLSVEAAYGVGGNGTAIMEYLDRGIYAVKAANGMFVSWRYNANDSNDAEFRLYRDGTLIYTSKSGNATSYLDKSGSASSKYRVDTVEGGKVTSSQNCKFTSGNNYFDIKLNRPGSQYTPNDCCAGDVDGDGQYEIFLKWDPSNAKDNSQSGKTDKVYIDCYTLEGKQLWRVDLGQNIRAGQHYTQMCVADFDCDGKAELITKTADGTKDGTGKVIGDASKNYANGSGYVLDGPEFMTLFEGKTGKALDTIDFPVPRGKVSDWGDNYGNRVDRFNSAIAYLDGVHPTAVYGRGYYTRLTLSAIDVKNGKLVKRWVYDSGKSGAYGNGNHNVMVADVDDDGKQEIFMGASAIDDNGKLLWVNGKKHGDAMHLGDFLPDRAGIEAWVCHESSPYGLSCLDAKTGKTIFHINGSNDTGRCAADNIYAGNKGAEFWGATDNNVYDQTGKKIGGTKPAQNFFIYWDGDLEREILDGNKISKMTGANKIDRIFTANGCKSNNGSKSVPCLTADLFGDWREELVLGTDDGTKLRIWCTTSETKVRLTTLMHDMQYRMQAGCEQSCYNQPPHTSFYLGSDTPLPTRPKVKLNNNPQQPDIPTETTVTSVTTVSTTITDPLIPVNDIVDGKIYAFKNANSGLYLDVAGAAIVNGTNIQQANSTGAQNKFKAVSAGNGYFYLISALGDGNSYALDVNGKKTDNGTNIELYTFNKGDNQQFKFVKNNDNSYSIRTKMTNDASCVEVSEQSTASGANVQQWTYNGGKNQKWYLEAENATSVTTTSSQTTVSQTVIPDKTLYGDINLDGNVTSADILPLINHFLNIRITGQAFLNADVQYDGDVDLTDLAKFKQYLVGDKVKLGK